MMRGGAPDVDGSVPACATSGYRAAPAAVDVQIVCSCPTVEMAHALQVVVVVLG